MAEEESAQRFLLSEIDKSGSAESSDIASKLGLDHLRVVGIVKSLESFGLISAEASTLLLSPKLISIRQMMATQTPRFAHKPRNVAYYSNDCPGSPKAAAMWRLHL